MGFWVFTCLSCLRCLCATNIHTYVLPLSFVLVSLGLVPPSQRAQKTHLFLAHCERVLAWCHHFVGGVQPHRLLASSLTQRSFANNRGETEKNVWHKQNEAKGQNSRNAWNIKRYLYMNNLIAQLYISKRNRLCTFSTPAYFTIFLVLYKHCGPHV